MCSERTSRGLPVFGNTIALDVIVRMHVDGRLEGGCLQVRRREFMVWSALLTVMDGGSGSCRSSNFKLCRSAMTNVRGTRFTS